MSKFLADMAQEAKVRVASYKAERETLTKAAARIEELDALIAEAEGEVVALKSRLPKEEVALDPR